jgi:hypothetical protein
LIGEACCSVAPLVSFSFGFRSLTSTDQAELVAARRRIADIFVKVGLPPAIGDHRRVGAVSPTSTGDTGAI